MALGRDKNPINDRRRVLIKTEWIKGGCRICRVTPPAAHCYPRSRLDAGYACLIVAERVFQFQVLKIIAEPAKLPLRPPVNS